jgi:hypothetical protein
MDVNKRREIAKKIYASSTSAGKSTMNFLKGLIEHPERIRAKEEHFNFDDRICLTNCDGHCCTGDFTVILSVPEVDTIVKALKITGEERKKFITDNFHLQLGSTSHEPLAIIKFKELNGNMTCPFAFSTLKFMASFNGKDSKVKLLDIRDHKLCKLGRKNKPILCALYPLGRVFITSLEDQDHVPEFFYGIADCPATMSDLEVKIDDFVGNFDDRQEEVIMYHEWIKKVMIKLTEIVPETFLNDVMHLIAVRLLFGKGNLDERKDEVESMVTDLDSRLSTVKLI